MAGRPSLYTIELADEICAIISNTTLGLNAICRADNMPDRVTIYRWVADNKEFRNKYARAKELQAELLAEEIMDIADDVGRDTLTINKGDKDIEVPDNEWINRSRLRIDARKWLLSKLLPKKYGDKLELSGDPDNPIKTLNEHRFIVQDMTDGGSETKI